MTSEKAWWWEASCLINGCLGGWSDEPLCSRAWRRGWPLFDQLMAVLFRDPVHCEAVHQRWQREE